LIRRSRNHAGAYNVTTTQSPIELLLPTSLPVYGQIMQTE